MYANQHEALREIEQAIDWEEEGNLTAYGRIALEYGLRFNAMGREWATWAVHQIT
jgi:PadR family transcriptional regulator, regulatory protein AphA